MLESFQLGSQTTENIRLCILINVESGCEPRNLLNLNKIHIIPLTGTRLSPWQSPRGAVEFGVLSSLYRDVVEGLDSDLPLQRFPENSTS
jgi:hypothetical protein